MMECPTNFPCFSQQGIHPPLCSTPSCHSPLPIAQDDSIMSRVSVLSPSEQLQLIGDMLVQYASVQHDLDISNDLVKMLINGLVKLRDFGWYDVMSGLCKGLGTNRVTHCFLRQGCQWAY